MIWRLRFFNKNGVEARVEIQRGSSTPIIDVEGTDNPFTLSYNNDKGNKSGMFLTSSVDIEIYETEDFNIDDLKTSNETELAVTYYINNVVKWKGFIIPDFFSIEVRNNPVIVMTASDRLGTLKNATLSDLPSMIRIRELAISCLNKTGLSLPLKTMADFSNDDTDNAFFSYYVDSQRIKDVKGRAINCYDILSSILTASNSKLLQRGGEWVIINKLQHEIGSGKVYSDTTTFTNYLENIYNFNEVSVGARRTINPVAGSVGIYHEHGGRKSHPVNYDYSLGLSGWNSVNGFVATIEDKHIIGFLGGTPLFDPDKTVKQYLLNYNNWIDNTTNLNTAPYITTDAIPINSPRADRVEVTVDISSTMAEKLSSNTSISFLRYAVILTNGTKTYALTKAGIFEELDPENISGHSLLLRGGQQPPLLLASPAFSNSESFKGLFEVGEDDNVNDYSTTIRIYGSGDQYVTVNYAIIKFSDVSELPKGTMYKTEQGNVFTKAYDIETSIFGDYLLSGLDGYFYRYPNDDTSSIYKDANTLSAPVWTTPSIPSETSELPLLHHSMRQIRRMLSVAHDLLSAEIEVGDFDPLAIFVACGKRYTVVSGSFDFFRSNVKVELEEVAFQSTTVREYIYSYFGDGEEGIRSIGGISGGAGGGAVFHSHSNKPVIDKLTQDNIDVLSYLSLYQTGVEMKPLLDEYGQPVLDVNGDPVMVPVEVPVLDEFGNPVLDINGDPVTEQIPVYAIKSTASFFSEKEVSAYGLDEEEEGGGYDMLQSWVDYTEEKSNWVVSAALSKGLLDRIVALEDGGGTGGSNVEWGTEAGGYASLTVDSESKSVALSGHTHSWSSITGKPSTFTPSAHTHSASDITSGTLAIARIPTGTTASTVALGNHTHAYNSLTGIPSTFAPSAHTHSASDITSGTFAIARIPTGTTGTTVALGNHLHTGVYEPVFTKNSAFNKNFGTTSGTVAQGNDSRINNGQTAYGWGDHALAGYALSSELTNYVTLATTQTITGAKTFSAALTASVKVTTPIIDLGNGWTIEAGTGQLELKQNGTLKGRFVSGGFVGSGEITAYS